MDGSPGRLWADTNALGLGWATLTARDQVVVTHGKAGISAPGRDGSPAAINESMSDVLAELAEQTEFGPQSAWVMGEDLHVSGVPGRGNRTAWEVRSTSARTRART